MIKLLWIWFKPQFLRLYAAEQSHPITKEQMEKCFVDMEGRQYYKFPGSLSLPIERFGKLQEFMKWMSAAITGSELDSILDKMDEALMDGLKNNKGFAKIGSLVQIIRDRRTMAIPSELLYNYLAVQVVREDEAPEYFNNAIHLEKIEQFKKEVQAGNSFDFFTKIGLKTLSNWFTFSKEEWEAYWEESVMQTTALQEALKVFTSGKTLSEAEKK